MVLHHPAGPVKWQLCRFEDEKNVILRPLDDKLVDGMIGYNYIIGRKWIKRFLRQFEEVQGNANHIHFKSLSALLSLHESIALAFQEKFVPEPEVIE